MEKLYEVFFKIYYIHKKSNVITHKLLRFYNPREVLFLFYIKTYNTLQALGLIFGISDFSTNNNIDYIIPYLKISLKEKNTFIFLVLRALKSLKSIFKTQVIFLFTERKFQYNVLMMRMLYIAKNHFIILLVICDKNARILYFGKIYLGSTLYFAIFKKELPNFNYKQIRVWASLGFIEK